MRNINFTFVLLLLITLLIISGCGKTSDQETLQLNAKNLVNVLNKELGEKTSYGAKKISTAKMGADLNIDQRNATLEVLGSINFDRFAYVRFVLKSGEHYASRKQDLFKDMSTIYQICFNKFEKLSDLLVFAEYRFEDGELKSVAVAHMSKSTAENIDWNSFEPSKIPQKADYFEWIRTDF